jgi:putative two-component system response regulator
MSKPQTPESTARILVVDDEPAITVALAKKLRREGYDCLTASSGEEALRRLATAELDLVVTDVRMPGMSGIELLQEIKRRDNDIQVVMMTAYTDIGFAVEALRHKADDYLLKPFNLAELSHSVSRSLEHRRLLRENRAFQEAIRKDPGGAAPAIEKHGRQALAVLSWAIETRGLQSPDHLGRVARIAVTTGDRLGLSGDGLKNLWLSAVLRDVGMLRVSESILTKPGPLDEEEWEVVRSHPLVGARLIDGIPYLESARPGLLQHHERWDGSGYPSGLAGGEIALEGCILGLADAYAAMLSDRPYRKALSEGEAVAEVDRCAGHQFDRRVVQAFHDAREAGFIVEAFDLEIPERSI